MWTDFRSWILLAMGANLLHFLLLVSTGRFTGTSGRITPPLFLLLGDFRVASFMGCCELVIGGGGDGVNVL